MIFRSKPDNRSTHPQNLLANLDTLEAMQVAVNHLEALHDKVTLRQARFPNDRVLATFRLNLLATIRQTEQLMEQIRKRNARTKETS